MPQRDDPSIRRQWILLRSLSSRQYGLTVREMAAEAGVADKTIRRDLILFRELGFPLEETTGDYGLKRWRIKSPSHQPPLGFSYDEALALYLGRRLLDPLAGTVFWEAAQRAFRKIRATLGEPVLAYLERLSSAFHLTAFGASDYAAKSELIDALAVAIEDSRAAHILYQSDQATEPAFRDVYPYAIVYHRHRGALYLIAYDPDEEKVKHYKINRIEEVEVSPFPFRRPDDFDPAEHLAQTFGVYHSDGPLTTIKVRFAPAVARYVLESQWHPSQVLTKQRDGSLLAEFQLASTEEFRSWVLSFGRKAVVLEPEALRREIAEELHSLATAYGLDSPRSSESMPADRTNRR